MTRKKIAETITTLVNFSLVYFTCMKKSTTTVALQVAITSATTVLKRPKSMFATHAVTNVRTIRRAQIPQYIALGRMCSECPDFSEDMALTFVNFDQSDRATETNKSK